MKSFKEQFAECHRDGYHEKGDKLNKKTNAKKEAKTVKKEKPKKETDRYFVKCLRFGGICDSANKKCRKMRGVD